MKYFQQNSTEAQRKEIWKYVLQKVAPVVRENHNPTFPQQIASYLNVLPEYKVTNIILIDTWMTMHNMH